MAYSTGANNVFIDLSGGGKTATANDELSGTTDSVDVTYMTSGAGGAIAYQTQTISVGAGTNSPTRLRG